jgi:hypothetical protein
MTQLSKHHAKEAQELPARERIDALLDDALMDTFPASDPTAIGSGTAAIKKEHHKLAKPKKPVP